MLCLLRGKSQEIPGSQGYSATTRHYRFPHIHYSSTEEFTEGAGDELASSTGGRTDLFPLGGASALSAERSGEPASTSGDLRSRSEGDVLQAAVQSCGFRFLTKLASKPSRPDRACRGGPPFSRTAVVAKVPSAAPSSPFLDPRGLESRRSSAPLPCRVNCPLRPASALSRHSSPDPFPSCLQTRRLRQDPGRRARPGIR